MRHISGIVVAMILAIALYFALFWGFDALRILTSPAYGLEDVWRSQIVFGIGRFIGLDPAGLIKLAAMFGALKLVVAGACMVHVLDRARTLIGGKVESEILETGLLIAVALCLAAVLPALWTHNADLVREIVIQLLLAALAAALCIIERSGRLNPATVSTEPEAEVAAAVPAGEASYRPWRR